MADYTLLNLRTDVEDMAPKFEPDYRLGFGHAHSEQEETYLVLSGTARLKLDDEEVELGALDAVRIPPGVMRSMGAGPDGAELIAFCAPDTDNKDIDMKPGFFE